MTWLTKIDTLSYLIKEPKPVTPVQVPNNMRAREIMFRFQSGQAYYSTESAHVEGEKKKENKGKKKNHHHMWSSQFQILLSLGEN